MSLDVWASWMQLLFFQDFKISSATWEIEQVQETWRKEQHHTVEPPTSQEETLQQPVKNRLMIKQNFYFKQLNLLNSTKY